MSKWVAITALGQDRPGIVAGITKVLYEHGCNMEDSSAMRLRDAFAMILIAKLPEEPDLHGLCDSLGEAAKALGVSVDLRDLGGQAPVPPPEGRHCSLAVYGADQPGIVYHVAEELSQLDCNIVDVTTHSAGPVYLMLLEMIVPEDTSDEEIELQLARLREQLRVDITLRRDESETL